MCDEPSKPVAPTVLVVGLVAPGTGPWHKLHAWANGFASLGFGTDVITESPTWRGVRSVATYISDFRRCAKGTNNPYGHSPLLIFLRSHWSVPLLLPQLVGVRRGGIAVVVEIPTPIGAAFSEITGSDRPPGATLIRLAAEWLWTPLGWWLADVVVQTCPDRRPWVWIARTRHLTLTNGVVNAADNLCTQWRDREDCTFISVGALSHWHGLDRLLRGMAADTAQPRSRAVIVGDGPESARLTAISEKLGLGDRVTFTGSLNGSALEAAYAAADVAVAPLAEHRRGSYPLSPLKTRDYLWRGLPVLYSGDDPDLQGDLPWALRAPADDTGIDIKQVTAWLAQVRSSTSCQPQRIRQFAHTRFAYPPRAAAVHAALMRPRRRRRLLRTVSAWLRRVQSGRVDPA
jgi:hypothetical protein